MSKWDRFFINVADETAKLSHAVRLKVGAVAVRDRRIICCGFNGTAPGRDNCCEYHRDGELTTKDEVVHAEANLICHAAKHGISLKDTMLYITHAPCLSCATLVSASGITKVMYKDDYRRLDGVIYLNESGITTTKWSNE